MKSKYIVCTVAPFVSLISEAGKELLSRDRPANLMTVDTFATKPDKVVNSTFVKPTLVLP